MSKIVCNIEETVCTPSSNPTVTGSYIRCNIDDPTCIESTPTEGGGAAAPTYTISGPSSINESESGIFTVATTGVDEGLLIPYTLTGVQSADVVGGSLTGTFEIDANGSGSVTIQMVDDFVAEGETMVMTIGSALNPLDFINVSIVDPTYSLSSAGTMVEGDSLSFNLTTTGISDGQTRNWDITGSGHSLSATSGTLTINSNAASVSISSVYNTLYQGTSNFTFRVFGSDNVTVVDTINFTVTDAASTYSQSSATSFDEGTSLAVNVATTNVQDSTTLYWTINHGTTSTADFTAESGSFTVTSNSGSFNVEAVADLSTEGAETFTIELRTGSITGPIVDTSSTITINDTSLSVSYSQSSATSVDEGASLAVTVSTVSVPDATTLYWTINHGTTSTADFTAESGSFTITSNSGSFNVEAVADTTTEGSETFSIELRTGSITGPIVDTSSTITINDTSLTPPASFSNRYAITKATTTSYTNKSGINSGASISNPLTSSWSISFWFKSNSDLSGQNITDGNSANDLILISTEAISSGFFAGFSLGVRSKQLRINFSDNGAVFYINGTSNITDTLFNGSWHNVIVTHSGTSNSVSTWASNCKVYIDNGTALSSAGTSFSGTPSTSSTTPYFGKGTSSFTYLTGMSANYDEMAVWTTTELDSTARTALYNSGSPTDLENTTGVATPTVYYRCEDNTDLGYETISASNTTNETDVQQVTLTGSDSIKVPLWSNDYYMVLANGGSLKVPITSTDLNSSQSIMFRYKSDSFTATGFTNQMFGLVNTSTTQQYGSYTRQSGLSIQLRGDNSFAGLIGTTGINYTDTPTSLDGIDDGNWHTIILIWNSPGGQSSTTDVTAGNLVSYLEIYVDSYLSSSKLALTNPINSSGNWKWGTPFNELRLNDFINGATEIGFAIDEVAYWQGHALTESERNLAYNNGSSIDLENTANLTTPTTYHQFEDSNNQNYDNISDSNTGTVTSGTTTAY